MAFEPDNFPKVLTLLLELHEYPTLAPQIRERMREELFKRGVISKDAFEAEVRDKAIQSQVREGMRDPENQEPLDAWMNRLRITGDNLTDFYFAYNLPHELFEQIVRATLAQRGRPDDVMLTFHPELAPWDMLFAQGEAYEALPEGQRAAVEHHLQEIKVVLIKSMISDHLQYVGIAKEWFSIEDLKAIRSRRIGRGKIGGKAAGIELARRILSQSADPQVMEQVRFPRSWFLAADVFYRFTQFNDLFEFANQKYKSEQEIRDQYPAIRTRFENGRFPEEVIEPLRLVLAELGSTPVIVRSSSLLEDSFGFSFAGKYESIFCANQGNPKQNLSALVTAITDVYSGIYSPDVLVYRRHMGLLDYDERMAVLIQEVHGSERQGRFFPDASGVAFSQNQYRWSPKIERQAGFMRLVWGLGTRAVDQVSNDYPRLVALSHPELRPDIDPERIRRYSQRYVDLIDYASGSSGFRTLPVEQVLTGESPNLRWIAQRFVDDGLQDLVSLPVGAASDQLVVTFDGLLRRTRFAGDMTHLLQRLERAYGRPVDVEFVAQLKSPPGKPTISLLQCRPQSRIELETVELPDDIPQSHRLFVSHRLIPDGRVNDVRYLVFISPFDFHQRIGEQQRTELARLVGRINSKLAEERFIFMGPGRWGSQNPGLGIPVRYGDIYHALALVEVVPDALAPEPSYGTHFYQDLVEAGIYPLAVALGDGGDEFNREFFERSANRLSALLPDDAGWEQWVKVIETPEKQRVELVMNGGAGMAIAYLKDR